MDDNSRSEGEDLRFKAKKIKQAFTDYTREGDQPSNPPQLIVKVKVFRFPAKAANIGNTCGEDENALELRLRRC
jgi:hypothetical protein